MLTIRPASLSDAQAIQAIYTPYVEKTAFTFEYEVPSVQEFEKRICKTLEKYPYLVAEENGQVLGYAYASTYYARTALCSQRGAWTRDWIGPLYGLRRGVASTRLLTLSGLYRCSERSEHFHA